MKILKAPAPISIQVELDYDELCGLMKMIGNTSVFSRKDDYDLTQEQSEALSTLFMTLSNYIPEEDR